MLNEKILILGFMLLAYLVGSISSAVLVSRLFGLPDPRQAGSHNPGTTNVLRLGGKWPAALTLLGDVLKGFVPVFIAKIFLINPWGIGLIGLSAFLGHLYPLYFNFVGGKGVATFWGVLMAWYPLLALAFGFTWLLVAFLLRISSLASLVASILSI
ncbi:MAG TPA: glycerol-3-phosphate 1-O-acyltransferase PlsY, partial [Gammaproteobacteria bacterium]|nr:glycerol-3-phosphate 1-O-acyltransferase PlsY [Gammaproteobacteria bacterium]